MAAVTSSGTATLTLPTDEQILITRDFNAPKHLVYKAWTTPELVKRWWSGHMKTVDIDLRVGGAWRYVMMAEGGSEVAFHGTYREIVPDQRVVCTEVYEMPDAPALPDSEAPVNTVTLSETDGRTTLTLLTQCTSKDLRDMIINSGMEVGMQHQMDRLEQVAISLR